MWAPRPGGTSIRYKDGSGKIKPARIVAVTDATAGAEVLTITLGDGLAPIAGAARIQNNTSAGPGWYHAGR